MIMTYFVDCYRNKLLAHRLDTKKGKYNDAFAIGIPDHQTLKSTTLLLLSVIVDHQPNQIIFNEMGIGKGVKDYFDKFISQVDFIKMDDKGNMKYVQYMSAEEMMIFLKRIAREGETNGE